MNTKLNHIAHVRSKRGAQHNSHFIACYSCLHSIMHYPVPFLFNYDTELLKINIEQLAHYQGDHHGSHPSPSWRMWYNNYSMTIHILISFVVKSEVVPIDNKKSPVAITSL